MRPFVRVGMVDLLARLAERFEPDSYEVSVRNNADLAVATVRFNHEPSVSGVQLACAGTVWTLQGVEGRTATYRLVDGAEQRVRDEHDPGKRTRPRTTTADRKL